MLMEILSLGCTVTISIKTKLILGMMKYLERTCVMVKPPLGIGLHMSLTMDASWLNWTLSSDGDVKPK